MMRYNILEERIYTTSTREKDVKCVQINNLCDFLFAISIVRLDIETKINRKEKILDFYIN